MISKIVDFMRLTLNFTYRDVKDMLKLYDVDITDESMQILHALETFKHINKRVVTEVDFVDMVFLPATRNIKIKQFHNVFVDEAQDLSRAQQELIRKIVRPNQGRLIAVGDSRQAIYGFAGSDTQSFSRIKTLFPNMKELPLSVCYRCGVNIVKHSQKINPKIEWFDKAEEGVVRAGSFEEIGGNDFVLCRNTRPLVSLFVALIKMGGIKVNIKGKMRSSMVVLGVDKKGNVLFIFSRSPYTPNEFSKILLKAPIQIQSAMYLEGGPESSLNLNNGEIIVEKIGSYVSRTFAHDKNQQFRKMPNVIGIKRK